MSTSLSVVASPRACDPKRASQRMWWLRQKAAIAARSNSTALAVEAAGGRVDARAPELDEFFSADAW
jgi:hypothetical protein